MKKWIYAILTVIVIIGAIIIGIKGFNVDLTYSKHTRIDIYIGQKFDNKDIKAIAQEVFGNKKMLIQKIEYYEDIASVTIAQENTENIEEKLEQFNTKINEKYGLEGKVEDIKVTNLPKAKLLTVLNPYLWPIIISTVAILIYALIKYRKLNSIKTALEYLLNVILVEGAYIAIIAITRIPINNIVISIALLLYVLVITFTTIFKERKLSEINLIQEK